MAGLLADVLPFIYSQGDRAKRYLDGLLSDPAGTARQYVGNLNDQAGQALGLLAQSGPPTAKVTPQQAQARGQLIDALGPAVMGTFAGVKALTANKPMLAQAEERLAAGDDPVRVWQETGWGRGPDGKMRFEIDDSGANLNDRSLRTLQVMQSNDPLRTSAVGDVLSHQQLFGAYPDIGSTSLDLTRGKAGASYYRPQAGDPESISLNGDLSTLLHELQHATQQREGFAKGGSPEMFNSAGQDRQALSDGNILSRMAQTFGGNMDAAKQNFRKVFNRDPLLGAESVALSGEPADQILRRMAAMPKTPMEGYSRLAGEAEARLTERRMNMTPAQRAGQYPWQPDYFQNSTGVPVDSLILR
jgi:hypothetical protein